MRQIAQAIAKSDRAVEVVWTMLALVLFMAGMLIGGML